MKMKMLVFFSLLFVVSFISCTVSFEGGTLRFGGTLKVTLPITLEDTVTAQKAMSREEQDMSKNRVQHHIDRFKKLQQSEHYEELKSVVIALNQSEKDYAEAFNKCIAKENDSNKAEIEVALLKMILIHDFLLDDLQKKINDTKLVDRYFIDELKIIFNASSI
jgi:hypothetical protein